VKVPSTKRQTAEQALGFLIPTVIVVTGLHLSKELSVGEAVDGPMSSFYFAAVFLCGALPAQCRARRPGGRKSPGRNLVVGMSAGAGAWVLLFAAWSTAPADWASTLGRRVFVLNSAVVLIIGASVAMLTRSHASRPGGRRTAMRRRAGSREGYPP